MTRAIVTSKGQVTIPKEIRNLAHIGSETELDFTIEEEHIVITPVRTPLSALKGIIKTNPKQAVTLLQMEQAIKQRASRKES